MNKIISKYKQQLEFLKTFADTGIRKVDLEQHLITTQTLRKWLQEPTFRDAYLKAQQEAGALLEDEAWRRAVKGVTSYIPVFYRGEECGTIEKTEYSDKLLELLLKATLPEKYSDRHIVDIETRIRDEAIRHGLDPEEAISNARKLLPSAE